MIGRKTKLRNSSFGLPYDDSKFLAQKTLCTYIVHCIDEPKKVHKRFFQDSLRGK